MVWAMSIQPPSNSRELSMPKNDTFQLSMAQTCPSLAYNQTINLESLKDLANREFAITDPKHDFFVPFGTIIDQIYWSVVFKTFASS